MDTIKRMEAIRQFEQRKRKMLRQRKTMTLKQIGELQSPPISRERVRQIIGNTGRISKLSK